MSLFPSPQMTSKIPTCRTSKPTMRRVSEKPHFFTFVCSDPSSKNGSIIPKSFILKYLKGVRFDFALLKRGSRSWDVELSDVTIKGETARVFANGWEKFEKENGFKTGDFIVFRLEGNFVFEILVFDPTFCEREFPVVTEMEGKQSLPKGTKSSKEPTTNIHRSKEMSKFKAKEDAACCKTEDRLSFSSTLKPYNIKGKVLFVLLMVESASEVEESLRRLPFLQSIPLQFARSNGLRKKCGEVILMDEKQRSWPVNVWYKKTHVYLGKGWSNFRITNGLKEGDEFMIERIKHATDQPIILNFRLLNQNIKLVKTHVRAANRQPPRDSCDPIYKVEKRKRSKREDHDLDNLEAQTKEQESKPYSRTSAKDHFVGILKHYSFERQHLYFPLEFARSNGFITNGQMILENENEKMWLVELKVRDTGRVYIAQGWKEFRIANNLKEGDGYKIELIKNAGKLPIAKFSLKKNNIGIS